MVESMYQEHSEGYVSQRNNYEDLELSSSTNYEAVETESETDLGLSGQRSNYEDITTSTGSNYEDVQSHIGGNYEDVSAQQTEPPASNYEDIQTSIGGVGNYEDISNKPTGSATTPSNYEDVEGVASYGGDVSHYEEPLSDVDPAPANAAAAPSGPTSTYMYGSAAKSAASKDAPYKYGSVAPNKSYGGGGGGGGGGSVYKYGSSSAVAPPAKSAPYKYVGGYAASTNSRPDTSVPRPAAAPAASSARDWNKEWITLLQTPATSTSQKLEKFLKLQSLFDAFSVEATKICKVIVEELHLQNFQKTVRSLDAGGVAGGVKYMKNNIFFKFTLDQEGLYSGDEFAAKAAGRELQGLESYFSWILHSGSPLKCAMQMLVDYGGYRLIASSLLPIGSNTLKYGSNDAGRTVHADDLRLNRLLKEAGEWLNLKKHIVTGTEIYGPADIEGHEGKDGNYYILDTARIFPPEIPPRYFQALIVPVHGLVSPLDVPSTGFEETVKQIVGDGFVTTQFFLGTIYSSGDPSTLENVRCQNLTNGRPCFGKAVIIPNGYKGKFLYNLLRRELVQNYKIPLSSDAFSGFGRHNFKEHNDEVAEASLYLKTHVLPKLVRDINSGVISCSTGAELTKAMHRAGVNMRLLGLVWSGLKNKRTMEVAMAEMITRAAKQLLRGIMRSTRSFGELKTKVINHLNLLLGGSQSSIDHNNYWEVVIQTQIRAKFGGYGDIFKESSYRKVTNKLILYKRLSALLGLSFPEIADDGGVFLNAEKPFAQDKPFVLLPRVKTLIGSKLHDAFTLALKDSPTVPQLTEIRQLLLRDQDIAACNVQIAVAHFDNGEVALAQEILLEVVQSVRPLSLDLRCAAGVLLYKVLLKQKELSAERLCGFLDSMHRAMSVSRLVSPLYLYVTDALVQLLVTLGLWTRAAQLARDFHELMTSFKTKFSTKELFDIFGRSVPLSSGFFSSCDYIGRRSSEEEVSQARTWIGAIESYRGALLMTDTSVLCGPFSLDPVARGMNPIQVPDVLDENATVLNVKFLEDVALGRQDVTSYDFKMFWSNTTGHQTSHVDPKGKAEFYARDFKPRMHIVSSSLKNLPLTYNRVVKTWTAPSTYGCIVGGLSYNKLAPLELVDAPQALFPSSILGLVSFVKSGYLAIDSGTKSLIRVTATKDDEKGVEITPIVAAANTKFVSLSGTETFWCAVTEKQEVYSWGEGSLGNLGHGDSASYEFPKFIGAFQTQKIVQVCTGYNSGGKGCNYAFARSVNGDVFTWGNFVEPVSFPSKMDLDFKARDISAGTVGFAAVSEDGICYYQPYHYKLILAEEIQRIPCVQCAAGANAFLFLSVDGEVFAFGSGGVTGIKSLDRKGYAWSSQDSLSFRPEEFQLESLSDIVSIFVRGETAAALNSKGEVYVWGTNWLGISKLSSEVKFQEIIGLSESTVLGRYATQETQFPLIRPTLATTTSVSRSKEPLVTFKRIATSLDINSGRNIDVVLDGDCLTFEISIPKYFEPSEIHVHVGRNHNSISIPSNKRPLVFTARVRAFDLSKVKDELVRVCLHPNAYSGSSLLADLTIPRGTFADLNLEKEFVVEPMSMKHCSDDSMAVVCNCRDMDGSRLALGLFSAENELVSYESIHDGSWYCNMSFLRSRVGMFRLDVLFGRRDNYICIKTACMVETIPEKHFEENVKASEILRMRNNFKMESSPLKGFEIEAPPLLYVPKTASLGPAFKLRLDWSKCDLRATQKFFSDHGTVFLTPTYLPHPILAVVTPHIPDKVTSVEVSVSQFSTERTKQANEVNVHVGLLNNLLVATTKIQLVRTHEEYREFCQAHGLPIPEAHQEKSADAFCVSFVDKDLYYLHSAQQVQLKWACDKTVGMSHNIYLFPRGEREMTKMKTAAVTNDNPTLMYIPQMNAAEPVPLEIVLGYYDVSATGFVWSAPLECAVVADDRTARQLNRKRLLELNPPAPVVASGPAPPSEEDVDAVEKVAASVKPMDKAAHVKDVLLRSGIGKDVFRATYSTLRSLPLDVETSTLVFAAVLQILNAEFKKLTWMCIFEGLPCDKALLEDWSVKLDGFLPLSNIALLDQTMLADAGVQPRFFTRVLENAESIKKKYRV